MVSTAYLRRNPGVIDIASFQDILMLINSVYSSYPQYHSEFVNDKNNKYYTKSERKNSVKTEVCTFCDQRNDVEYGGNNNSHKEDTNKLTNVISNQITGCFHRSWLSYNEHRFSFTR